MAEGERILLQIMDEISDKTHWNCQFLLAPLWQ
jgi:hypothetical protein